MIFWGQQTNMGTYYHSRICHRNMYPALLPLRLIQARVTHIPRPLVHQESVKRKTRSDHQIPLSPTPIASLLQNEDIMQSFEMKWKNKMCLEWTSTCKYSSQCSNGIIP